jgi:hypothetical protein
MSAPIEIGDVVETEDGQQMLVVNIFRDDAKMICCQCVDANDDPSNSDLQPPKITYRRSQIEPIFSNSRYQV